MNEPRRASNKVLEFGEFGGLCKTELRTFRWVLAFH